MAAAKQLPLDPNDTAYATLLTERFRQRLLDELDAMKVETDTSLLGWWSQWNEDIETFKRVVRKMEAQ